MRDGTPLPGLTPAQLVSQLVHREFGPLRPERTRTVLDYHGLLDNPAGSLAVVATRHRVSTGTVSNHVAAVRAAGARQPLPAPLLADATRASAPGEDHPGRVRIATTLGLPAPAPAAAPVVPADRRASARTGLRVLAAVGPLDITALAAAVARSRRFRTWNPLSDNDLAAALAAVGCTQDPAGRWHPPAETVPSGRDRVIVTRAAGQVLR